MSWPGSSRPSAANADPQLACLEPAIDARQTNRRRFADEPVPEGLVDSLRSAAHAEGSELFHITDEEHRLELAALSRLADRIANADPGYRAELRRWTSADPRRLDGVRQPPAPPVTANAHDDVPRPGFDTHGTGWLPDDPAPPSRQCLVLLGTNADNCAAWAQCGEALERVLLEISRRGFAASPLADVIEVPCTRTALREVFSLQMHPHILIVIGRAPLTLPTRAAPARRRPGSAAVSNRVSSASSRR